MTLPHALLILSVLILLLCHLGISLVGPRDERWQCTWRNVHTHLSDVIRAIDGRAVVSSGDLPAAIGLSSPGDKVRLDVWRKGEAREIVARLGSVNE